MGSTCSLQARPSTRAPLAMTALSEDLQMNPSSSSTSYSPPSYHNDKLQKEKKAAEPQLQAEKSSL